MSGVVWVSATVLKVLAEQGLGHAGAVFTATQLRGWVEGQLTRPQRLQATGLLGRLGFWTVEQTHEGPSGSEHSYTITPEGAAAIAEAAAGKVRRSGPKSKLAPRRPPADSLLLRLWTLFRMRGALDPDSAARLLCDAGDEAVFKQARLKCGQYFSLWRVAGAAIEAGRRVGAVGHSNGFKRYVLHEAWRGSALPPTPGDREKAKGGGK